MKWRRSCFVVAGFAVLLAMLVGCGEKKVLVEEVKAASPSPVASTPSPTVASPSVSATDTSPEARLERRARTFADGFNAGDWEAMYSLTSPAYRQICALANFEGSMALGIAAIREGLQLDDEAIVTSVLVRAAVTNGVGYVWSEMYIDDVALGVAEIAPERWARINGEWWWETDVSEDDCPALTTETEAPQLSEARAGAQEVVDEGLASMLAGLSPAEIKRFEEILRSVQGGNPAFLTDDVHREFWGYMDRAGVSEAIVKSLLEMAEGATTYQRLVWTDMLRSLETGEATRSAERRDWELAALELHKARIDATQLLIEEVAARNPVRLPGQDISIVIDEKIVRTVLSDIEASGQRLKKLFTRPL